MRDCVAPLDDVPFLGAAVKLFLIALFAPLWWPVLVEVRAEILRSSRTARERAREPRPAPGQGFIARLHGERKQRTPAPVPARASRARRAFRASR